MKFTSRRKTKKIFYILCLLPALCINGDDLYSGHRHSSNHELSEQDRITRMKKSNYNGIGQAVKRSASDFEEKRMADKGSVKKPISETQEPKGKKRKKEDEKLKEEDSAIRSEHETINTVSKTDEEISKHVEDVVKMWFNVNNTIKTTDEEISKHVEDVVKMWFNVNNITSTTHTVDKISEAIEDLTKITMPVAIGNELATTTVDEILREIKGIVENMPETADNCSTADRYISEEELKIERIFKSSKRDFEIMTLIIEKGSTDLTDLQQKSTNEKSQDKEKELTFDDLLYNMKTDSSRIKIPNPLVFRFVII